MCSTFLRFNFTAHAHRTRDILWPSMGVAQVVSQAKPCRGIRFVHCAYHKHHHALLCPDPHPASSRKEKGSGVTSRNPWSSSRSMEQPMKLQSGTYWNNAEARTTTSILLLKVLL